MFGKNEKIAVDDSELKPCLTGELIFQMPRLKRYLVEIKNLVSCPDTLYQQLYLSTLYCFAECCQAMPYSKLSFDTQYGLLERQLTLAIATLKLRRGHFFPKNVEIEQIAKEEPQWTYAIFSAALLRNLTVLQHRAVLLYQSNGEYIGKWSPLSGSLYENQLCYQCSFEGKTTTPQDGSILMATIAGRIIPSMAFRWLGNNEPLYTDWWNAVLHKNAIAHSDIMALIENSANIVGIKLDNDADIKCEPVKEEEWKFHQYIEKSMANLPDSIFRLTDGLFIDLSIIADFSKEQSLTVNQCLDKLKQASQLILNQDDPYHSLSSKKFEDRQKLKGVILSMNSLPDFFQTLPINDKYQKTITL